MDNADMLANKIAVQMQLEDLPDEVLRALVEYLICPELPFDSPQHEALCVLLQRVSPTTYPAFDLYDFNRVELTFDAWCDAVGREFRNRFGKTPAVGREILRSWYDARISVEGGVCLSWAVLTGLPFAHPGEAGADADDVYARLIAVSREVHALEAAYYNSDQSSVAAYLMDAAADIAQAIENARRSMNAAG